MEVGTREEIYTRADAPLHPGAALGGADRDARTSAASASASCSRATSRARRTRRRAAGSARAAGRRRRSAPSRSRRSSDRGPAGHPARATSRRYSGRSTSSRRAAPPSRPSARASRRRGVPAERLYRDAGLAEVGELGLHGVPGLEVEAARDRERSGPSDRRCRPCRGSPPESPQRGLQLLLVLLQRVRRVRLADVGRRLARLVRRDLEALQQVVEVARLHDLRHPCIGAVARGDDVLLEVFLRGPRRRSRRASARAARSGMRCRRTSVMVARGHGRTARLPCLTSCRYVRQSEYEPASPRGSLRPRARVGRARARRRAVRARAKLLDAAPCPLRACEVFAADVLALAGTLRREELVPLSHPLAISAWGAGARTRTPAARSGAAARRPDGDRHRLARAAPHRRPRHRAPARDELLEQRRRGARADHARSGLRRSRTPASSRAGRPPAARSKSAAATLAAKASPLDWPRTCGPLSAPHLPATRTFREPHVRARAERNVGKIVEIKGVVIDAVFSGDLPDIYNALAIEVPTEDGSSGGTRTLIAEVQQHLGDDRVRAVAMDSTDGLARGIDVRRHRRADLGAGRRHDARPDLERHRRAGRQQAARGPGRRALVDPPRPAGVPRALAEHRDLRDRA